MRVRYDTFNELDAAIGALEYLRASNALLDLGLPGGDNGLDTLHFSGTFIEFFDTDDAPASVSATGTISAVPEPGSVVLLVTALAVAVFTARCKLSIRPPN